MHRRAVACGGALEANVRLHTPPALTRRPPACVCCPQASAICIGHSNLLIVHGGRNNFVLEDLHVLDFVVSYTQT